MNAKSTRCRCSVTTLVTAATLALVLAACGDNTPLSARAAEPTKEVTQPSALDPALKTLDGVIHHG